MGFPFSKQPANRVQRMGSRVAKVGRAVFPEEVPVIMEMIFVERTSRCRTEPQVVMNARRFRAVRHHTDRISGAIDDNLPSVDRSQSSFAQELDRFGEHAAAAPLSSGLHYTAISSNVLV